MKKLLLVLTLGSLAACSVPIENATVIRSSSGKETLMTGMIHGSPVGDSPFEMNILGSSVTCSGKTNMAGKDHITCTDGFTLEFTVPKGKYGTFSGSYVERLADGRIMAFGWGSEADHAHLRQLLKTYLASN